MEMNPVECHSLRETGVRHAQQRPKNAQQTLCHVFLVGAHDNEHTVEFCTVNDLCRAFYIARTANILCRAS
jgi:hypothetical protein